MNTNQSTFETKLKLFLIYTLSTLLFTIVASPFLLAADGDVFPR